ncbi:hypothetical protein [Chitinophaga sp.]|uniref:hypothetical protein n=1 Tax=Chitinophaga sp. TaxID=1869181 RepID=UPI002F94D3BC
MEQNSSTIFDNEFIEETSIRRRDHMGLGLKIYVWVFLITSVFALLSSCYALVHFWELVKKDNTLSSFSGLLFSTILFLSSLFILLEKKWGILFAVTVLGISFLIDIYSLITLLIPDTDFISEMISIFWCVVKIPYFILLLRIKKDWETKAFSAKELRANKSNS